MSLHRNLSEHEADPPSRWTVRKRGDRVWALESSSEGDLDHFPTKRAAEQAKESGFWANLYRDEGRWYRGESVHPWRRLARPAEGPAGGYLDPAVSGQGRTRQEPERRETDASEDATIRRYAIHRRLAEDVADAERHEDAAARLDRALRYSGGRSRHRAGSLLGRTGDRSARRRGER
jgi:hypothetical protein